MHDVNDDDESITLLKTTCLLLLSNPKLTLYNLFLLEYSRSQINALKNKIKTKSFVDCVVLCYGERVKRKFDYTSDEVKEKRREEMLTKEI